METNQSLINWLYRIHCKIDKKLGNKNKILKICRVYESHRAKACSKKS